MKNEPSQGSIVKDIQTIRDRARKHIEEGAVTADYKGDPKIVVKLLNEALATVDDTKRADLLARATEVAIEDVGIIPLHYQVNTWAMRRGFTYQPRTDEYTLATGVGKAK